MTQPVRPSFKKKISIKTKLGIFAGIIGVFTAVFVINQPSSTNLTELDSQPTKANTISVAGTF